MTKYYGMSDELYHYGVLGQKWGVRRYQNKDGSLTKAGIKRYGTKTNFEKVQAAKRAATVGVKKAKAKAKADARTEAEIQKWKKKANKKLGSNQEELKTKESNTTKSKPKTLSEMSNEEIEAKIERIKLENRLKELTPRQTTKGEKFAKFMGDKVLPKVEDLAADAAKKYGKKMIGELLGVDLDGADKAAEKAKKYSEKLKQKANDYENLKKIDQAQKYFKEGRYAEKPETGQSNNGNNSSKNNTGNNNSSSNTNANNGQTSAKSKRGEKWEKTETYTGTVEGEGMSRSRYADNNSSAKSTKSSDYYDPIDVDWRDSSASASNRGISYISQLLLEDRNR